MSKKAKDIMSTMVQQNPKEKSPHATLNRLDDNIGYRHVARGPFLPVGILANFK